MNKTLSALAATVFLSVNPSEVHTPPLEKTKELSEYAPTLRLFDGWNRYSSHYFGSQTENPSRSTVILFTDPNGEIYKYDCLELENHLALEIAKMVRNEDSRKYRATTLQVEEFRNAKIRFCNPILA
jgi:hypothetical protein